METKLRRLEGARPDPEILREAGEIIKKGGLVAFPTETVYGLGGDALNPMASQKIYAAKGRPSDNPLIVHIARKADLYEIASEVSEQAEKLIERFWPGPLTLIFQKKDKVPRETTGGLSTVAVRMPGDQVASAFIQAAGGFVAAPSANASGRPSTTTAAHVAEDLSGRIEMILDGGQAVIGLESTIVDVSEERPVILRPGVITKAMMEAVIGPMETDQVLIAPDSDVKPKAPGMKYRHYAPKAPVVVVTGESLRTARYIRRNLGQRTGVICFDEYAPLFSGCTVEAIGPVSDKARQARRVFEALRAFDSTDVDAIYAQCPGSGGLGFAVANRLKKAAGFQVVDLGEAEE